MLRRNEMKSVIADILHRLRNNDMLSDEYIANEIVNNIFRMFIAGRADFDNEGNGL